MPTTANRATGFNIPFHTCTIFSSLPSRSSRYCVDDERGVNSAIAVQKQSRQLQRRERQPKTIRGTSKSFAGNLAGTGEKCCRETSGSCNRSGLSVTEKKRDGGAFIAFRNTTAGRLAAGRSRGIGAAYPARLPDAAPAGASLYGRTKAGSQPASDRPGQRSLCPAG